ncbi:branched-chain amino acid ABC transporter permease [Ramlibacter sp. AN1015]|uniref:branched-chain amino acid ABC transporter permease n=1 Tax=Ramlibacter sp. AN1015 TaxID=3133428 RepID=UPI0030C3471C
MEIFGIPHQAFLGQLMLGLVNGAFYAILSLGLAVIFGLLDIVNFAHGALYMLGAFAAWIALDSFGINYWLALIVAPLVVGIFGVVVERLLLKRLYGLDPLYGLLLTFGLSLILEGLFRERYGVSGQSYPVPDLLAGATNLGFMILPNYRAWVVVASLVVCLGTWFLIERTRLGAYLRAGTENAKLVQAFGVNVPLMVMLTYGAGAALAAFAGVLAAPIIQVTPLMGSNLIIVVFAVVVIGGMGSIMGSILTGLGLGIVEGFTRVFYPEASNVVVFVIMAIVLMLRPAGLFGKTA